ncbi:hypothetical protein, partial [Achromobacter ruhlandii]|uniref:hypothetical protein n=1 Tax=Achromobacter ruhlandii TaxID=72557 RepID=UPI000B2A5D90
MNAPAPKTTTAPDEALSSLMGAALDVPAAPEQPEVPAWAPDNTLARTGNTEKEQAMWFGGMEQAQANAQDNAAICGGADWLPIENAPQTGRTLLLGYWNSLGKWRTVCGQWMSAEYIGQEWEEPDDVEAGWFETAVEADDVPNCWRIEPTHWMPLPAAPGTPASPVSTLEQDPPAAWMEPGIDIPVTNEYRNKTPLRQAKYSVPLYRHAPVAAPAAGDALTAAARDVLAERQRQISVEGWEPERDDTYRHGELA